MIPQVKKRFENIIAGKAVKELQIYWGRKCNYCRHNKWLKSGKKYVCTKCGNIENQGETHHDR
jgi:DNA-directed RNA polymerase subunit RPC12/RpoP